MTETDILSAINKTAPQVARARWLRQHIQSLAGSLAQISDEQRTPFRQYARLLERDIAAAKSELGRADKTRVRHASLIDQLAANYTDGASVRKNDLQRISVITKMMGIDAGLAECKRALIATEQLIDATGETETVAIALQAALDGLTMAVNNCLPNTPTRQSTSEWTTMLNTFMNGTSALVSTRVSLIALEVSDVMLALEKRRESTDGQLHAVERRLKRPPQSTR